jgi:endonuclease YncB( thermonuclease family)
MHSKIIRSLLGLFALTLALNLHAQSLLGRVVSVADGDTITVLDINKTQHRVRLSGIDAPEKNQAFGEASRKSLSELVANKKVTVIWERQDKYSRKLGKVMLGELDCNLEQLRRGLAWHYKKYENEQPPVDRKSYANAEEVARSKKVGLWGEPAPIAPWDFRSAQRVTTMNENNF